ncbi:hypothetical protein JCM11641_002111 [Rhodosporidiobolus odoratus]
MSTAPPQTTTGSSLSSSKGFSPAPSVTPQSPSYEKRSFYRSTWFQLATICVISFLGPGLWNGAQSLGAGGALEPYLVNAGNSIVFALMGLGCILAPVLVNAFGVKITLILGTLGWCVYTAALYQNNRYGTEWFVIFGAVVCGASAGAYWAVEGAIVLAYPPPKLRGRYLAIWLASKNSGQILAGCINLGTNIHRSTGGKVNYRTLLTFIALQALAIPTSFLISGPSKVQRADGTRIVLAAKTSTIDQFRALWRTVRGRKIGVLLPVFFASWWYWGYASTFLTLYFSVRARALASFLSAICGVLISTLLGFFLDNQRLSLKTRARLGALITITLFSSTLIWALVVQHQFWKENPGKLDWSEEGGRGKFGRGFGLYILLNAFGNGVQNYLYWLVGTLSLSLSDATLYAGLLRGVESWGQCSAFGVNSSHFNPFYTVVINCIFFWLSIPSALLTILKVEVPGGYGESSVHGGTEDGREEKVDAEDEKSAEAGEGREDPEV